MFPDEPTAMEFVELMLLGTRLAREKSLAVDARPDAYTMIYNHAARQASGWLLHILVHNGRVEKACLYFIEIRGRFIAPQVHLED